MCVTDIAWILIFQYWPQKIILNLKKKPMLPITAPVVLSRTECWPRCRPLCFRWRGQSVCPASSWTQASVCSRCVRCTQTWRGWAAWTNLEHKTLKFREVEKEEGGRRRESDSKRRLWLSATTRTIAHTCLWFGSWAPPAGSRRSRRVEA